MLLKQIKYLVPAAAGRLDRARIRDTSGNSLGVAKFSSKQACDARQRTLPANSLGLNSPWSIDQVDLEQEASEIRVNVWHRRRTKSCCPECDLQLPCHDHTEPLRLRHLDSCQFKTILVTRAPRVKCPTDGVETVSVPWNQKHSRFTIMFERFAIHVSIATQIVKKVMSLIDMKWGQLGISLLRLVAAERTDNWSKCCRA